MVLKKRKDVRLGGHSSGDDSSDDDGGHFDEEEEDEGDALLRDSTALKGGRGGVLEPGYLNIVRRVWPGCVRLGDGAWAARTPPSVPWAPSSFGCRGTPGDVVPLLSRIFFCGAWGSFARAASSLSQAHGGIPSLVLFVVFVLWNRCKDANQHDPAKSVVRAVSFHPTGELLLAGGFDKTLRLFQVRIIPSCVCLLSGGGARYTSALCWTPLPLPFFGLVLSLTSLVVIFARFFAVLSRLRSRGLLRSIFQRPPPPCALKLVVTNRFLPLSAGFRTLLLVVSLFPVPSCSSCRLFQCRRRRRRRRRPTKGGRCPQRQGAQHLL